MSGTYTYGLIGLTEENVGIDRRFYTGLTNASNNPPTLAVSYNAGRVDVFLNGIKLVGDHSGNSNYDYTMDSKTGQGSTVTLTTGVAFVASDVVECVGYVSNSSNTITSYNPTPTSGDGGFNEFRNITQATSSLVNVFLNGVLLDDSDYTLDPSTNGGTVTIGGATLTASDVVVIQVIGALDNSNFVPAGGGTFSGNVAYTGNIQVDDIIEKTSGHGVEIDGVLLKDGGGTFTGNVVIPDGGDIGSASNTDAISISSGGDTTFSENVFISGNELILDADNDTSITADTDDQIDFKTAGSDRLVIDSGGDVYSEPATTRTWTVVGITSLSQNSNFYKRIGKMVFISGFINGNGDGTTLSITNLPYAAKTGANQSITVSQARDNGTFTSEVSAQVSGGSSTLTFLKSSTSGSFSSGGGSKRAQFAGWYEAETV